MPIANGSFVIPSMASDGIQEIVVALASTRMPVTIRASRPAWNGADGCCGVGAASPVEGRRARFRRPARVGDDAPDMGTARVWLAAELRRRWRAVVAVGLLAGITAGLALAAVDGMR